MIRNDGNLDGSPVAVPFAGGKYATRTQDWRATVNTRYIASPATSSHTMLADLSLLESSPRKAKRQRLIGTRRLSSPRNATCSMKPTSHLPQRARRSSRDSCIHSSAASMNVSPPRVSSTAPARDSILPHGRERLASVPKPDQRPFSGREFCSIIPVRFINPRQVLYQSPSGSSESLLRSDPTECWRFASREQGRFLA